MIRTDSFAAAQVGRYKTGEFLWAGEGRETNAAYRSRSQCCRPFISGSLSIQY